MIRRPPRSTLFPYPPLSRSLRRWPPEPGRAAPLYVTGHDPHELGIGPRLPAVRLHGTSVGEVRVGRGPRVCEELLEPVHGEVQVEGVHVAGEDVDLAFEPGREGRPVALQVVSQVVVVGPEVLGHAAVDRAGPEVPQLGGGALPPPPTLRPLPDREPLA